MGIHRFPTFCAVLVGGSTLLQAPIKAFIVELLRLARNVPRSNNLRIAGILAKFTAALISSFISFSLLNDVPLNSPPASAVSPSQPTSHLDFIKPGPFDSPPEPSSSEVSEATLNARSLSRKDLAGKTMDLTLFSVVRALDVVISSVWNRCSLDENSRFDRLSRSTPTVLFCASAATIMRAWFYNPSRLPQSYNSWISAAAEIDHRLILALRHARYGTWVYGKDTGMAPLLGSMCRDYGLPEELGDPARTIPLPCEVVHMGCGKSCEKHALLRFWKGWKFAARMYAPIQLVVLLRHLRATARHGNRLAGLTQDAMLRAFLDMIRSSAFLGAFISFYYYGICLSRTRLGPRLFSAKSVTPQMWDSGLCITGASLVCGLSLLVEQQRKRLEAVLFVLPRAAAVWFPRRYLAENRWKEQLAFTVSAAVLLTVAQEDPRRVRGVFGNALHGILKTE